MVSTATRNLRVLFVVPSFPEVPKTGGEIYHRKVVDGLIQDGCDITVCAVDELISGRSIHDQACKKLARKALQDALSPFCTENAVVIYDSWLYRVIWPVVWKIRKKCPCISLSQLCYWDTYRSLHSRLKHRLLTLLALSPAVLNIGVSRAVLSADTSRIVSPSLQRVIYPGCDYAGVDLEQADCSRIPAQIITVGNYGPRKGFHVLVEALAKVFGQTPALRGQLTLRCVGNLSFDAEYVRQLRSQVQRLSLEDSVVFDDWKDRQELSRLFSGSQLFILASESEGFGMVVLEAMLHGLPVVLNNFMTAEELIGTNGEAGWIVKRNHPGEFARFVLEFFTSADRNHMGKTAGNRAREISRDWDAVSRQFAQVIGDVYGN